MGGILEELDVAPDRSVLLLVDMMRGYFDPEASYHPLARGDAERVVEAGRRLLGAFRGRKLPVIYTVNYGRRPTPWGRVDKRNPFLTWQEEKGKIVAGSNFPRRTGLNVEGSPFAQIHAPLAPREGEVIVHKLRYDAFYGTHLEVILKALRAEEVFLAGVNTNNCVLATAFATCCRDFRVFLVEDACASMNGPPYHQAAVDQVAASLGWVVRSEEVAAHLARGAPAGRT